jgi:hypothetical protein
MDVSYERLKTVFKKTKGGAARLRLEVELIAAEKRKSLRDRRQRLKSSEYVISTGSFSALNNFNRRRSVAIAAVAQDGLFVPDFAENVHKQRKRARDASLRYETPYSVSPDEIEGFNIESTGATTKRPRTDEPEPEGQPTRKTPTETAGEQARVPTTPETNGAAGGGLEQAQPNAGGTTQDMETSLLLAISQARSCQKPKKRAPRAKTAKEVHSRKAKTPKAPKASKAGKAPKDAQGVLGGKVTKGNTRASKTAKASKKASKHKAMNSRGGLGDGGEDLLHSLFFTDAIALRQAQGDYGEAPVIGEKSHKDRMLKELMASIPKDVSSHPLCF